MNRISSQHDYICPISTTPWSQEEEKFLHHLVTNYAELFEGEDAWNKLGTYLVRSPEDCKNYIFTLFKIEALKKLKKVEPIKANRDEIEKLICANEALTSTPRTLRQEKTSLIAKRCLQLQNSHNFDDSTNRFCSLIQLFGNNWKEIGACLGCSPEDCERRSYELKIEALKELMDVELTAEGKEQFKELIIAHENLISVLAQNTRPITANSPWTKEAEEQLFYFVETCEWTWNSIGKYIQHSPEDCEIRYYQLKIVSLTESVELEATEEERNEIWALINKYENLIAEIALSQNIKKEQMVPDAPIFITDSPPPSLSQYTAPIFINLHTPPPSPPHRRTREQIDSDSQRSVSLKHPFQHTLISPPESKTFIWTSDADVKLRIFVLRSRWTWNTISTHFKCSPEECALRFYHLEIASLENSMINEPVEEKRLRMEEKISYYKSVIQKIASDGIDESQKFTPKTTTSLLAPVQKPTFLSDWKDEQLELLVFHHIFKLKSFEETAEILGKSVTECEQTLLRMRLTPYYNKLLDLVRNKYFPN